MKAYMLVEMMLDDQKAKARNTWERRLRIYLRLKTRAEGDEPQLIPRAEIAYEKAYQALVDARKLGCYIPGRLSSPVANRQRPEPSSSTTFVYPNRETGPEHYH